MLFFKNYDMKIKIIKQLFKNLFINKKKIFYNFKKSKNYNENIDKIQI